MKNIDWKRKLTSRKLWTAVASFVSMMIVATGGAENTATQVTALIMAGASVVAYIIGEGLTDSAKHWIRRFRGIRNTKHPGRPPGCPFYLGGMQDGNHRETAEIHRRHS